MEGGQWGGGPVLFVFEKTMYVDCREDLVEYMRREKKKSLLQNWANISTQYAQWHAHKLAQMYKWSVNAAAHNIL